MSVNQVQESGGEADTEVRTMIYMAEITYPGTKIDEAVAAFVERLKTNPLPEYVKIRDMYSWGGGDGLKVLTFYEVDDANAKEGMDEIARGLIHYMKNIEGYKAEPRMVYTMEQAFAVIDMQPPTV